jgi:probable addiction module antidote protein
MNTKIKVADLPDFDMADYLHTDSDMAEYLSAVIEDGDVSLLAAAMGDIAKARGMSQIAKESGITREALYKALRPNAQPRFDTIARVCKALGLRLTAQVHMPTKAVAKRRPSKIVAD